MIYKTFAEWAEAYPARLLDVAPIYFRYQGSNYEEAENTREFIEEYDEVACETVRHGDTYYVIYKND